MRGVIIMKKIYISILMMLIIIGHCFATAVSPVLEFKTIEIRTYPYRSFAVNLEALSLCIVNFFLLKLLTNKINHIKNSKLYFISIFSGIITFFIGKYLENFANIEVITYITGNTLPAAWGDNSNIVLRLLVRLIVVIDIIVIIKTLIKSHKNKSESEKINEPDI